MPKSWRQRRETKKRNCKFKLQWGKKKINLIPKIKIIISNSGAGENLSSGGTSSALGVFFKMKYFLEAKKKSISEH